MRRKSMGGDQGRVGMVAPLWHPAAADEDYPKHSNKSQPFSSSPLLLITRKDGNKQNSSSRLPKKKKHPLGSTKAFFHSVSTTTSSSGSNSGSDDEHYRFQKLHNRQPHRRRNNVMGVFVSPLAPRRP
ncbi:hypothetical protein GUJ93_ZPchr0001g31098 [Zizania palustris]|uniref:Uncharacterized protein n=1 Tax=Zizania palustris TaxID=103762 RepID=A0A8J5VA04_ZIZPA|nr:hypothetical protein GUJ93_ZPchr0001g31098 [Zizania palustris]